MNKGGISGNYWPGVQALRDDLENLPANTGNQDAMVLTPSGRLTTAVAYRRTREGTAADAPDYSIISSNLRDCLSNKLQQKKLSDREVKNARHVTLGDVKRALSQLEQAPPAHTASQPQPGARVLKPGSPSSSRNEATGQRRPVPRVPRQMHQAPPVMSAAPEPTPQLSAEAMENTRLEGKRCFVKGFENNDLNAYLSAFKKYRAVVENGSLATHPTCYKKCVMELATMIAPEGPLYGRTDYQQHQLAPYLELCQEQETPSPEAEPVQASPTTGQRRSESLATQQRAPNLLLTQLRRAASTPNRLVDSYHPEPGADQKLVAKNWGSKTVSMATQEELEYRVEIDPARVAEKLDQAGRRAMDAGLAQPAHPGFPSYPGVTGPQPEELKSESFPELPGVGAASAKGVRSIMEDAHGAQRFVVDLVNGERAGVTMLAVCDGHSTNYAGNLCSGHVVNTLPDAITRRLGEWNPDGLTETGVWNALKLALVDVDHSDYLYERAIDHTGTTANVALVIGDRLWVANAGDSRAMLAYPDGTAVALSEDAKPGWTDDQTNTEGLNDFGYRTAGTPNPYTASVLKRGGHYYGGPSVGAADSGKGTLRTTHALGDHSMGGVISARPKITSYPLDKIRHATLVQCCDGVFDVASCEQVSRLLMSARAARINDPQQQAKLLVEAGFSAGSTDNLTAMVTNLSQL